MTYKAGKINANADALSRNPIPRAILPFSLSDPGDPSFPEPTTSNNSFSSEPTTPQENKTISKPTQTSQIPSNK